MMLALFESYYKLGMNEQGSYLMSLMQILPVQRRRHGNYEEAAQSRRQCTVSFTVPDGQGNLTRVCKKTFMETFDVRPQKITTLVKRKKEGSVIFKDKRGGLKRFKYTLQDRQMVKNHINEFPREESHYNRNKSEKEYLSSDLNVNRLFEAYKIKHPATTVTYKFYRSVFLKDFPRLSFKKPRVDTCKTCDSLNIKSKLTDVTVAQQAKTQLELHHRQVENVFKAIKHDAANSTFPGSDTCTITIDLQKVFALPKLTHTSMYYSRQLSCYNFGIHVADTADGIMCIWHEGQSGRGGNQMASCILQALNTGLLNNYKRKLCVWSDNCAGQLKNRMLLFLYIFLVTTGMFDTIDHKFLISGHSFSASDRDFAIIEKRARVSKLNNVEDVKKCIGTARPTHPFKVLDMGEKKFLDFCSASSKYIDTSKLGITQTSWMRITKDDPGVVFYKTGFSDLLQWKKLSVLKKAYNIDHIKSVELSGLPDAVPLKPPKKKDIEAMLEFLSEENREFFRKILSA